MTLSILLIILLTLSSGYFSSSETALFSLSSMKVRSYQTSSNPRKQLIAELLRKPRDLLVTVFMLNTLVNILLQNVASHMYGESAGWDLKVGVPFVITLVFGEIIPKYIGLHNNAALSYLVAPSIHFFQVWIEPIRKWTVAITNPISRFMFFFLKKEKNISRDELKHALETSEERGILSHEESELMWGYLKLHSVLVKELMNPREDILFYSTDEPLTKLTYLFIDQECSRVPVCEGNLDNVLGMISARQFFLCQNELNSSEDLKKHLSKPFYIPETTSARILLSRFDERGKVIALAVDEYGTISGIISREDLTEVVVGEIADRRDQKVLFTRAGKNEIIASGKLELHEFNQIFNSDLTSSAHMVTIGGWLTEQLGTIPKSGTHHRAKGFLFQVLAADPNRIKRLYIRKHQGGGLRWLFGGSFSTLYLLPSRPFTP
jgi:CBS domain containing-hemolysin-like protein